MHQAAPRFYLLASLFYKVDKAPLYRRRREWYLVPNPNPPIPTPQLSTTHLTASSNISTYYHYLSVTMRLTFSFYLLLYYQYPSHLIPACPRWTISEVPRGAVPCLPFPTRTMQNLRLLNLSYVLISSACLPPDSAARFTTRSSRYPHSELIMCKPSKSSARSPEPKLTLLYVASVSTDAVVAIAFGLSATFLSILAILLSMRQHKYRAIRSISPKPFHKIIFSPTPMTTHLSHT